VFKLNSSKPLVLGREDESVLQFVRNTTNANDATNIITVIARAAAMR